jgi:hypothetical protein
VVQIAHGLGEHMGRYAELAKILLEDEFAVYGNDHRGHGLLQNRPEASATLGLVVLISSWKTWFLLESSLRTNTRESRTFCWGTAWVRSQRSNLFSITVIQLMAWCCQVLAHSTA